MPELKNISIYTFISGTALLIDYCAYFAGIFIFDAGILFSLVLGYSIGLLFAYVLLRRYCFTKKYPKSDGMLLFWFVASGLLGVVITLLGMHFIYNILNFHYFFSRVMVTGLSFSLIYLFRRLYVFNV